MCVDELKIDGFIDVTERKTFRCGGVGSILAILKFNDSFLINAICDRSINKSMLGVEAEAIVNSFLEIALQILIQVGEDIGTGHQRVRLLVSSSARTLDSGDETAKMLGNLVLLAVLGDYEPEVEEVFFEVHRAKCVELALIH